MKFRVIKEDLLAVMARGGVSLKADPMLKSTFRGYGHIALSEGKLKVLTSGPSMASMSFIPISDMQAVEGSASLSLEEMQDVMRFFPKEEEILVEHVVTDADQNGSIVLCSGKVRLSLQCINRKMYSDFEFPGSDIEWCEMDYKGLVAAMQRVAPFTAFDAEEVKNNFSFRCDGKRLFVGGGTGRAFSYTYIRDHAPIKPFFIPAMMVKYIGKVFDDGLISVGMSGTKVYVRNTSSCIRMCLPEGLEKKSPDFLRLIGVATDSGFILSSEKLLESIGACNRINSTEMYVRVRDGAINFMSVSSRGTKYHSAVEYATPTKPDIPPYDFAIPPVLMVDFVRRSISDVKMEFSIQKNEKKSNWPIGIILSSDGFNAIIQTSVVIQQEYGI